MEFSIESAFERINHPKSKEYFKEIKSSYENNNYRSVIVSLYSIVICDLVFKLQSLRDVFSDSNAEEILIEIEELQKSNPKSPDWERKLIEKIREKTELLPSSTYEHIIRLQAHRHLCAHPILEKDYYLYQPNRETAVSHIRNILEELLTQPAVLSNKILAILLEDIAKNKNALLTESILVDYLNSRFLKHMSPNVKSKVFRSLWKITYNLINEECDENRSINARTLRVIYEDSKLLIQSAIRGDKDYFSRISGGEPASYIVGLISFNPEILALLNSDAKILIKAEIETNDESRVIAWFDSPNLSEHLNWIVENESKLPELGYGRIKPLHEPYLQAGLIDEFHEFTIELYAKSKSVDVWRNRHTILKKHYEDFDKKTFEHLLTSVNKSSYITTKPFWKINKVLIEEATKVLGEEYDFNKFEKLTKFIPKDGQE